MNEKSIEKEEWNEINEKERVEKMEILVERLKKESELGKSERIKENECFIEKQENEKEEQREKEIVVVEKIKEVNFYANDTNSFSASKSLCVQNSEDPSKDKDGKLSYKSIKMINFFLSTSYLSLEIYFKDSRLFSLVFMELKTKGRSMEKVLRHFLKDLPISRCFYAKESAFIEAIKNDEFVSLLYCKEELSGLFPLREMEHQIELVSLFIMAYVDEILIDVYYGFKLLMTFDLIGHVLRLDDKPNMKLTTYIHYKIMTLSMQTTRSLMWKMTKYWEFIDLPPTVGPSPTIPGRLLPANHLEAYTLPRPV
ncbi:hypothetical protein M9H77_23420 [Catharanthus roseus]|uniref:Uncharacterized protein n=1 Tax=Catharanthus roseus TaxID=4058 RepID=A0ACC0AVR7_CATRO|nr:hypothetical protein M9H77_23420 [Catharanthus roseus]